MRTMCVPVIFRIIAGFYLLYFPTCLKEDGTIKHVKKKYITVILCLMLMGHDLLAVQKVLENQFQGAVLHRLISKNTKPWGKLWQTSR